MPALARAAHTELTRPPPQFAEAISYGVVKVNLDTDMQYAFLQGIRDYMLAKKDYVSSQVGNPDGDDKPNKKCVLCLLLSFPADDPLPPPQVLRPPRVGARGREDDERARARGA